MWMIQLVSWNTNSEFSQSESDTEMTLQILNSLEISGSPPSHTVI